MWEVGNAHAWTRSYRRTLNQRDGLDDEQEQQRLLSACHKRCAERTLRVLEQCGGIFIKLGQHLVGDPFILARAMPCR